MLINPTTLRVSHILLISINLKAKECQRGIPKDDQENDLWFSLRAVKLTEGLRQPQSWSVMVYDITKGKKVVF